MKILMTTADNLMIDRRILQEAWSLISLGHEVTLLAGFVCPHEEDYDLKGIHIKRFKYEGWPASVHKIIKKLNLNNEINKALSRLYNLFNKVFFNLTTYEKYILEKMSQEDADILHIHDFPMLKTAVFFAKKRKIKLIYDAHELYYAQVQLPHSIQKKYKKQESTLIHHADEVITVNPYIGQLMVDRYQIASPNIIMNALPSKARIHHNLLQEKFNLPEGSKIVLYQGWISSNRGIENIVKAAKYFNKGIYLVLIGYGDYVDVLKQWIKEHDLTDKVFFYGEVPSEQMHELTCGADLGVIPYYGVDENNFYCSPNKLFEFAIAHVPFISNDLPFLRDIIEQYQYGETCNLNHPLETADLINQIIGEPARLEQLKLAASHAALSLNWEQEQKKLFQIYEKL